MSSRQIELANAIQEMLNDISYNDQTCHFYFGKVNNIEYPFFNIYFGDFGVETYEQNRWQENTPSCVVEFAYASDTDDETLYEFGDKIVEKLSSGIKYQRRNISTVIRPETFTIGVVDGFVQVIFDINYQIDTYVKMDNDNLDKMESLDLDLTIEEDKDDQTTKLRD